MADTEKNPLSITETIAVYSGVGDMSERKITEEQREKEIAFFEEQRKKALASLEEQRKRYYGEKKQEILPPLPSKAERPFRCRAGKVYFPSGVTCSDK